MVSPAAVSEQRNKKTVPSAIIIMVAQKISVYRIIALSEQQTAVAPLYHFDIFRSREASSYFNSHDAQEQKKSLLLYHFYMAELRNKNLVFPFYAGKSSPV